MVGDIKSIAFEQKSPTTGNQSSDPTPASWAGFHRLVFHPLKLLKLEMTLFTFIFVRGHNFSYLLKIDLNLNFTQVFWDYLINRLNLTAYLPLFALAERDSP